MAQPKTDSTPPRPSSKTITLDTNLATSHGDTAALLSASAPALSPRLVVFHFPPSHKKSIICNPSSTVRTEIEKLCKARCLKVENFTVVDSTGANISLEAKFEQLQERSLFLQGTDGSTYTEPESKNLSEDEGIVDTTENLQRSLSPTQSSESGGTPLTKEGKRKSARGRSTSKKSVSPLATSSRSNAVPITSRNSLPRAEPTITNSTNKTSIPPISAIPLSSTTSPRTMAKIKSLTTGSATPSSSTSLSSANLSASIIKEDVPDGNTSSSNSFLKVIKAMINLPVSESTMLVQLSYKFMRFAHSNGVEMDGTSLTPEEDRSKLFTWTFALVQKIALFVISASNCVLSGSLSDSTIMEKFDTVFKTLDDVITYLRDLSSLKKIYKDILVQTSDQLNITLTPMVHEAYIKVPLQLQDYRKLETSLVRSCFRKLGRIQALTSSLTYSLTSVIERNIPEKKTVKKPAKYNEVQPQISDSNKVDKKEKKLKKEKEKEKEKEKVNAKNSFKDSKIEEVQDELEMAFIMAEKAMDHQKMTVLEIAATAVDFKIEMAEFLNDLMTLSKVIELSQQAQKQSEIKPQRINMDNVWNAQPIESENDDGDCVAATIEQFIKWAVDTDDTENGVALLTTYQSFTSQDELLYILLACLNPPTTLISRERIKQSAVRMLLDWFRFYNVIADEKIFNQVQHAFNTHLGLQHKDLTDATLAAISQKAHLGFSIGPEDLPDIHFMVPTTISSALGILLDSSPEEIAKQLALISSKIFMQIDVSEFINLAWDTSRYKYLAPNVIALIKRTDKISNWVATSILSPANHHERAQIIMLFIRVAKYLRALNDFNSLMGVLVGFSTSSVNRLRRTWDLVDRGLFETFRELETLMSPQKSFSAYRVALSNVDGPCVPFLANSLSDLTFIEEGNKGPGDGRINFDKIKLIFEVISTLEFHKIPYKNIQQSEPLSTYLAVVPRLSEDQQYDLSMWHEPREVALRFPPVLATGTLTIWQTHGFSPSEIAEIIDLIVESHMNDPRYIFVNENPEKRAIVLKVLYGQTLRWLAKNTRDIYVAYEPNDNPNAPRKMCAVSVWLEPGVVIQAPPEAVIMEFGKLAVKLGRKTAQKTLLGLRDLDAFVKQKTSMDSKERGTSYWTLFYWAIKPEFTKQTEIWEHIFWSVFRKADELQITCWAFVSDPKRKELLSEWYGFKDDEEPGLIGNSVPVWAMARPNSTHTVREQDLLCLDGPKE